MPHTNPVGEVQVPVRLDDRDYVLYFNANTMVAYEQETGRFFLDTVASLLGVIYPEGPDNPPTKNPLAVLRRISMTDLRALIWSALHTYDKNGVPTWPMAIHEVGRHINTKTVLPLFNAFLKGQSDNTPTKKEVGESPAVESTEPPAAEPPKTTETGGESGIELPEDALG